MGMLDDVGALVIRGVTLQVSEGIISQNVPVNIDQSSVMVPISTTGSSPNSPSYNFQINSVLGNVDLATLGPNGADVSFSEVDTDPASDKAISYVEVLPSGTEVSVYSGEEFSVGTHTIIATVDDASGTAVSGSAQFAFTVPALQITSVTANPDLGTATIDGTNVFFSEADNDTTGKTVVYYELFANGTSNIVSSGDVFTPGQHSVFAVLYDSNGDSLATSGAINFTIVAPVAVPATESPISQQLVTVGADNINYINGANIGSATTNLTGQASPNDIVRISINGGPGQAATVAANGSWYYTITGLSGGTTYSVVATATGSNGATAASAPYSFTVDTTPPTFLGFSAGVASTANGGGTTFIATFSEAVVGVQAGNFSVVSNGTNTPVSITNVTPVAGSGGTKYAVTVGPAIQTGTERLELSTNGITDEAGNLFALPTTTNYGVSTGDPGIYVAAADFNGDGVTDLLSLGQNGTLSVLLGKGDGTFETPITYDLVNTPDLIATGDFNHDGNTDVAIFTPATDTISLLLGNGNGTLQAPTPIIIQTPNVSFESPQDLTVVNLTNNGIPDLIVDDDDTKQTTVLLGNADGSYSVGATFSDSGDNNKSIVGDFNGDGEADIVQAGKNVTLYLGEGNGTFGAGTTLFNGEVVNGTTDDLTMATADLNGDGKADLVIADYYAGTLNILLNNGLGGFTTQVIHGLNNVTIDGVADMNGDGIPDILIDANDAVLTLYGNGDGTFQSPINEVLQPDYTQPILADVNGDGTADIIEGSSNLGNVTISLQPTSTSPLYIAASSAVSHNVAYAGVTTTAALISAIETINGASAASGGDGTAYFLPLASGSNLQSAGVPGLALSGTDTIVVSAAVAAGQVTTVGANLSAASGSLTVGDGTGENTGTVVLTGTESLLAGTSVLSGTLQIGDGGTTGTLLGNVVDDATLSFDRSDDFTFAGTIAGTGSVVQIGTGTLILPGVNNYSGGTYLEDGVTQSANVDAFGTGTIYAIDPVISYTVSGVYANAISLDTATPSSSDPTTFTVASGVTATISGAITTGSGINAQGANIDPNQVVVVEGPGTLNLTNAANQWSGGTRVLAGTLAEVDTGTALSTGPVAIASGATVDLFNDSSFVVYQAADTFSGTGTLEKTGVGVVSLGNNDGVVVVSLAQGAVIDVEQGTLRGSSGALADYSENQASLNIAAGATFDGINDTIMVDALTGAGTLQGGDVTPQTTVIGVANGSGLFSGIIQDGYIDERLALDKVGTGTEILTGSNTYTAGTTIGGGQLQIGNGGTSGSIVGDVIDNATLVFARSDAASFAGAISGSGNVVQTGPGSLTLSGHSSYSGGTELLDGTLDIASQNGAGSGAIKFADPANYANDTVAIEKTALDANGHFADTIVNFSLGATIDVRGIGLAASASVDSNGLLTLSGQSGTLATIQLSNQQMGYDYAVSSDQFGGTDVTLTQALPHLSGPLYANKVTEGNVIFNFTDADLNAVSASLVVSDASGQQVQAMSTGGHWVANVTGLAQGELTATGTVTDGSGSVRTVITTLIHDDQITPPVLSGPVDANSATEGDVTFTFNDLDSDIASSSLIVTDASGGQVYAVSTGSGTQWVADVSHLAQGILTATGTVTDKAGNVASTTTTLTHDDQPSNSTGTGQPDDVPCYCTGSLILTAQGPVAVEDLAVGDLVVTSSGAHRPIRWLGHRTVSCRNHAHPEEAHPIRIARHAFGDNKPAQDLYVSPTHAICVDVLGDVLIPAYALTNGSTVAQVDVDHITYWHVELDSHDILIANGLPAESYIDMGNREFFVENDVVAFDALPDAAPRTHANFCRPFITDGPILAAVRLQLRHRAQMNGWTLDSSQPFADLHLMAGGVRIDPVMRGLTARFAVPPGAGDLWLVSAKSRPSDVKSSDDKRILGVSIGELAVDDGFGGRITIALDDPMLCAGFHRFEEGWRWTAGRALLPAALWSGYEDGFFLRVQLSGPPLPRWVHRDRPECSKESLAFVA